MARWTREEMNALADALMDEMCSGSWRLKSEQEYEAYLAALAEGTGWTAGQFASICDYRWNGPAHVR